MKKAWLLLAMGLGLVILSIAAETKGYLFIIGGGERPESLMKTFVGLAGRFGSGKVIVFPMASSVPDETGPGLVEEFKRLGARDVECHNLSREQALRDDSAKILDGVGGIFFSGGDQSRHMAVLLQTPVHRRLLELYEEGCVIGGTSAGAAVMSEVMITGDEKRKVEEGHEFETIEAGNIIATEGLGFLKTAVVDQHFVTRKRHNRLISLIGEKPELLGVGIDESTAILVGPKEIFEVSGEKCVVVYDASAAAVKISPSRSISFSGLIMHVLLPGDRYDLKTRKVVR